MPTFFQKQRSVYLVNIILEDFPLSVLEGRFCTSIPQGTLMIYLIVEV